MLLRLSAGKESVVLVQNKNGKIFFGSLLDFLNGPHPAASQCPGPNGALNYAYQNGVTSQTAMPHVTFVTGIPCSFLRSKKLFTIFSALHLYEIVPRLYRQLGCDPWLFGSLNGF